MITDHGTLERLDDETARLTFVRDLSHPQAKVWHAITQPDGLDAWFPCTIEGERRTGAPLKYVFPFPDAPVMEGTMRAYEPQSVMEIDWGGDIVRIELSPIDGGTRLTLTDTFAEYAKSARDAGGWHACLDNLAFLLDGLPKRDDSWKTTTPWYLENFPPEATTAPIPDFVDRD